MRERPVTGISGWMRAVLIVAAGASLTACISYPSEPRYSTPVSYTHLTLPTTPYV